MNVDLSGGEKKRNETVQLAVLRPRIAILDEIDSGLDVDALRAVSRRIEAATSDGFDGGEPLGVLAITHYNRLLEELRPDVVHVFAKGRILESGGPEIATRLEVEGYAAWVDEDEEAEVARCPPGHRRSVLLRRPAVAAQNSERNAASSRRRSEPIGAYMNSVTPLAAASSRRVRSSDAVPVQVVEPIRSGGDRGQVAVGHAHEVLAVGVQVAFGARGSARSRRATRARPRTRRAAPGRPRTCRGTRPRRRAPQHRAPARRPGSRRRRAPCRRRTASTSPSPGWPPKIDTTPSAPTRSATASPFGPLRADQDRREQRAVGDVAVGVDHLGRRAVDLDDLAAQQADQLRQVLLGRRPGHRLLAEHEPAGEAGARAPPRCGRVRAVRGSRSPRRSPSGGAATAPAPPDPGRSSRWHRRSGRATSRRRRTGRGSRRPRPACSRAARRGRRAREGRDEERRRS